MTAMVKPKPSWLKWAIAVTVSFGAVLQIIDVSIVNVSLPQMQGNLGATLNEIGWVITGYAIANAIVIPLTAWLGGQFGQKPYFIFSLAAFVFASVMCGMSNSLSMLIVARVLQGLFGGGLVPRAQAILFETFPPKEQGLAQAVYGIGIIAGPTIGPTLGGYLTDTLGWRWIFFINIPVGIVAILMALAFLPGSTSPHKDRPGIDWTGIALLAIALGCLQVFLEEGEQDGWFDSGFITRLAIGALVGGAFFVWRELRTRHPAVDLRVLRHRELVAGSVYSVVLGIGLFGTIFVIPVLTQQMLGFSAVQTGLLMIPGALASAFVMPIVGASLNKVGARALITVGSVIVGAATLLLSQVTISTGWMDFFWPLLIRGFGMGFMFVPLSVATLGSLPKKDIPAAAGFFSLTRTVGGSVGVALMATILAQRQVFHYDRLIENVSIYNPATQQYLSQIQAGMVAKGLDTNAAQQAAIAMLNRNLHAQASILSFEDIYKIVAWMFFLCLPLVFFLGKGNTGRKPDDG